MFKCARLLLDVAMGDSHDNRFQYAHSPRGRLVHCGTAGSRKGSVTAGIIRGVIYSTLPGKGAVVLAVGP